VQFQQLFDLNTDPQAKQTLLSGLANMIHCPSCGFEGPYNTPIVYHDPDKELLLTYFPPELGLPVNEQERVIGPVIKKVVDNLSQEKRKAYLFRPQTMLTMQTMVEKILEGDGITKEMLDAQQRRVKLIERLISLPSESREEIIRQEEANIDQEFFNVFTRIIEITLAQGDQQGARQLAELQKELLSQTVVGREMKAQAEEAQEAIKSLQDAGKEGLTREKLLDLIVNAKSEARLTTLVSMARSGMDYEFFALLTQRIDKAADEEKANLISLRERLLEMTHEIDQVIQSEMDNARKFLNQILAQSNVEEAIANNLNAVNDIFIQVVKEELESAKKNGDLGRLEKLNKVVEVLKKASAPPPEIALIERLLSAENDQQLQHMMDENKELFNDQFIQLISGLIGQMEAQKQPQEVTEKLQKVYRQALRYKMQSNLKNN